MPDYGPAGDRYVKSLGTRSRPRPRRGIQGKLERGESSSAMKEPMITFSDSNKPDSDSTDAVDRPILASELSLNSIEESELIEWVRRLKSARSNSIHHTILADYYVTTRDHVTLVWLVLIATCLLLIFILVFTLHFVQFFETHRFSLILFTNILLLLTILLYLTLMTRLYLRNFLVLSSTVIKFLVTPGLIWKYRFWLLVGTMLKSNKALALKLADFVRRMIPHLAPCNALQDDVSCIATTSTFIAKTHHVVNIALFEPFYYVVRVKDVDEQIKLGIDFSNQNFKIGEGSVSVTKLSEDQYRFTCEARGSLLEDFVAITDWESMAIILEILGFWEASPKVGVVENLTLWGDCIYCHALNVKEIVEGVHKSPTYFSIFRLSQEIRFFVGCGNRSTTTSHRVILVLTYFMSLMGALTCYYQLKDNYPKVATGSVVILGVLPFFIVIIDFLGPSLTQSCFYWICTLLCCNNANWRLGVYIWLKKRGSCLPYCDDLEPDQLLLEDGKVEVNCLFKSVYKSRLEFGVPFGVKRIPDWTVFPTINIDNLDIHNDGGAPWTKITPNNNDNNNVKFKLFKVLGNSDDNYDAVFFKVEFTYTNYFIQSSRVIYVRSEYDRTQLRGRMTTYVSFNGSVTSYKWSVSSFHLFVYLVLMWGKTKHGVIEYCENFMLRTYNHVFSVHGLAEHIEKHGLETYYVLLADQTTQPVRTISQPVLAAKTDVNVITSCWNRLLRPCSDAFGHQSLGSVSVSV